MQWTRARSIFIMFIAAKCGESFGNIATCLSALRLQLDAALGMYDAVLHIGDFAYDLHDDDGKVGDEFLRMVEPMTAGVPYMVTAGNHEKHL